MGGEGGGSAWACADWLAVVKVPGDPRPARIAWFYYTPGIGAGQPRVWQLDVRREEVRRWGKPGVCTLAPALFLFQGALASLAALCYTGRRNAWWM
jgi:hypothetical protein